MKTLYFDNKTHSLCAIDQTKLPQKLQYIYISDVTMLYDAIKTLKIRGAPAIGVGAALGLYACALRFEDNTTEGFAYSFKKTAEIVRSSRPTARNLFYAVDRMQNAVNRAEGTTVDIMLGELKAEAQSIFDEDIAMCRCIGEYGAELLEDGSAVLTHCNAGSLCAVEYGTALSPIYIAAEQGKRVKVYADETRPLLQGARLTAFELSEAGIDTTVICDNMAASLMQHGKVDIIITGCDRVAANGDFANKVGTLSLAINAKHFGVPFYVAAPSSTVDESIPDGSEIIVEQRCGLEISDYWYSTPMVAPKAKCDYNPAFDVVPRELITGFITEKGVTDSIV